MALSPSPAHTRVVQQRTGFFAGLQDERWTLPRVQTLICRHLRVSLSVATVWRLLERHGWSWQARTR
ncbi:winged helix-turn-helix domain-containing protein [Streptomyces erythrochromogenes]|uniref:helix-turn-helix domain-containing protein n=1 Tax=Streptomyces erythrochromogenes TaxID=285574 RepID=UPI0036CC87E1